MADIEELIVLSAKLRITAQHQMQPTICCGNNEMDSFACVTTWETVLTSKMYTQYSLRFLVVELWRHLSQNYLNDTGTILQQPQSLQRRHNKRDGVSNHPRLGLLNCLLRLRSKKTLLVLVKSIHQWPVVPLTKDKSSGKCFHLMTQSRLLKLTKGQHLTRV